MKKTFKFRILIVLAISIIMITGCPPAVAISEGGNLPWGGDIKPTIEKITITFTVESENASRHFSDSLKEKGIQAKGGISIKDLRTAIKDEITIDDGYVVRFYRDLGGETTVMYAETDKLSANTKIKAKFEKAIMDNNDVQFRLIPENEYNTKSDDGEAVTVKDINLANFIRTCHRLKPLATKNEKDHTKDVEGATITKKHMRMFKVMSIAKCQVHDTTELKVLVNDLSGMEEAENLEELYLARNAVTDISPLFKLTKLTTLILRSNSHKDPKTGKTTYLKDLKGIGALANLEYLCLGGIQNLESTEDLDKLVNLKKLFLDQTAVKDISFVKNLNKLEVLAIDGTKVGDISAIKDLTNLKVLKIEGRQKSWILGTEDHQRINSLEALTNLINLEELKFSRHDITDISIIKNLKKLNKLELAYNDKLTDFSPLLDLKWIVNKDLQLRHEFPWSNPKKENLNFNNSFECIRKAREFKTKWDRNDEQGRKILKEGEYTQLKDNVKLFLKKIVESN